MSRQMSQEEFDASIAWSRVVVSCVIRDDAGRYLLVQESQPKVYGLWNLTGGHVDRGEAIEAAAAREAKEETGLDVSLQSKIGIWHGSVEEPVRHAFIADVVGGELIPQPDEILDASWFTYQEITEMRQNGQLRTEWMFEAISMVERSSE